MNTTIPERRTSLKYNDNCYIRTLKNVTEYYNKEYYNSDFTRKLDDDDILDNVKKDIMLSLIDDLLE